MTQRAAIAVTLDCTLWAETLPGAEALVRKAARAALAAAQRDSAPVPDAVELSLMLADASLMRRLNRDYRRKDKPTNVLSFPAYDPAELARVVRSRPGRPGTSSQPVPIGDVVLAFEVVRDEALDQGKPFAAHLAHLAVHGTLHLLGYDHEAEADAARMEALEVEILAQLGIDDPYDATESDPVKAGPVKGGQIKAGQVKAGHVKAGAIKAGRHG
jgi:probable rRNA maturation factor